MAEHNHAPAHGHTDHGHTDHGMDYAEHEKTYSRFISLVKFGSIGVVFVLIMMAMFLR